ncbi:hypothetical protein TNCV_1029411 [Trichonephila clavipes]|nr:hypothetical protein TNCV_1029411 [Trichonephila clavipes]
MWESMNIISRTMCELGHLLANSISNVLPYCKPRASVRYDRALFPRASTNSLRRSITFHPRRMVILIYTMAAELPHDTDAFVIRSHIYKKKIVAMTYAPTLAFYWDILNSPK